MAVVIWHNPRCSKSRAAFQALQDRAITPQVRLYLTDPPDFQEITAMLKALGLPAAALLRPREGAALKQLPDTEIIAAMAADPALIERPVVRHGDRAVIARPASEIDRLFS